MINWRKPVIYGLLYASGNKIPEHFKEIKRIEKMSKDSLKKYQDEKLKKILLHSWKNVPYYTSVLEKAGVVAGGKVNLGNFSKIPVLTKEIIRKEGNRMYSIDHKNRGSYENTSGGSTGEPVRFLQDNAYDEWNNATKIYFKTFGGQQIGDKELRLWGSERDLLDGKEKLSIRLRNWLYNRQELNAFKMSEQSMAVFVKRWNKFKPRWIEAYVQSIYEFGRFIKKNNLKIYYPNGILTSAGTLYPEMKQLIEEVFRCKVYNRYGSREAGGIACSCGKSDELHTAFWHNYLEVLDDKMNPVKHDEMGKVFVTTLNNFSMPLIRYDIGDMAVASGRNGCECGRNLPNIAAIEGRQMCVFKTKEGRIVPGEFFIHFIGVVYNKGIIDKFQVIQKRFDKICILVVLRDEEKFNEYKESIEDSIKKEMGESCIIEWKYVEDIPPLSNGKFVYTASEVVI